MQDLGQARCAATLMLGAAAGGALWTTWAHALGRGSPLDGGLPYLGSLFAAGLSVGVLDSRDLWPGPAGLYLGQAVCLAWDAFRGFAPAHHGEPLPLALLFLVSVNLATALGVAVSAGARIWLTGSWRTGPE
jgi:hypothetical protein